MNSEVIEKYNLERLHKEFNEDNKITLFSYKLVVRLFWKEISKEIIKGFVLETILGKFLIAMLKRRITLSKTGEIKNNVNWGESNKRKAQLIEEGKIPYKAIKDVDNKIIGDNGGEHWLVHFVDNHYFSWIWQKNVYLPNNSNYMFKIAKVNREALSASIDEDSVLLYQYRDGNYKKNI